MTIHSRLSTLPRTGTDTGRRWTFGPLMVATLVMSLVLGGCGVAAQHITPAGSLLQANGTPASHSGCGRTAPIPSGSSAARTITVGALTRTYWLHIPRSYQPGHRYPLVLNFHGHGSGARRQERYTGFSRLADQRGFVVAYPQGVVGPDHHTGWNSGGPNKPQVNDIAFVSTLLDTLQSTLCIDPARVYATGFSNGGGMTSVLACVMASRIAAFASVSGSYFPLAGGCHPSRPVPVLEIHGTGDTIVPYDGRAWQGEESALAWVTAWAARDGCQSAPVKHVIASGVIEFSWSGCRDGVSVVHYQLAGGWHVWPGATYASPLAAWRLPVPDNELHATAVIWQFFAAHPLPR